MLPTRLTEGAEGLPPPHSPKKSRAKTQKLYQLETCASEVSCKIQATFPSNHLESSAQETVYEPYSNRCSKFPAGLVSELWPSLLSW